MSDDKSLQDIPNPPPTINNNNDSNLDTLKENSLELESSGISIKNIPELTKILVTYDGKNESDKLFNHAISLSNYSGAELTILRILEYFEDLYDISVKGTGEGEGKISDATMNNNSDNDQKMNREVNGEIIDEMEKKILKCKEAGCKNEISYKIRTGNVVDEIEDEVKEGNYDLVILKSSKIDSWVKSLFSDTRKIMHNINTPVLLV